MARFRWLVFTNCADGREVEFNSWYDDVHVPDLLRVPGVVRVSRCKVAHQQMRMRDNGELEHGGAESVPFRYLAVYEFETDDPKEVLEAVRTRANTPEMVISPDLADVHTVLYQDI